MESAATKALSVSKLREGRAINHHIIIVMAALRACEGGSQNIAQTVFAALQINKLNLRAGTNGWRKAKHPAPALLYV